MSISMMGLTSLLSTLNSEDETQMNTIPNEFEASSMYGTEAEYDFDIETWVDEDAYPVDGEGVELDCLMIDEMPVLWTDLMTDHEFAVFSDVMDWAYMVFGDDQLNFSVKELTDMYWRDYMGLGE